MLSRVTLVTVKAMPGMDTALDKAAEKELHRLDSNIYSVSWVRLYTRWSPSLHISILLGSRLQGAEHLLLLWLSELLRQQMPDNAVRLKSYETDLQDSLAFFAAIVAHVPGMARYGNRLVRPARDSTSRLQNAGILCDMLTSLGLPFVPEPDEIASGRSQESLILAYYLFNTLPQLMPKGTIEFQGSLGQRRTKEIELNNPGTKAGSRNTRPVALWGSSPDLSAFACEKCSRWCTLPAWRATATSACRRTRSAWSRGRRFTSPSTTSRTSLGPSRRPSCSRPCPSLRARPGS